MWQSLISGELQTDIQGCTQDLLWLTKFDQSNHITHDLKSQSTHTHLLWLTKFDQSTQLTHACCLGAPAAFTAFSRSKNDELRSRLVWYRQWKRRAGDTLGWLGRVPCLNISSTCLCMRLQQQRQ
jgi:hypothetical protein